MKCLAIFLLLIISLTSLGNNNRIIAIVNENIITSQSIQDKLDASNSLEEKIIVVNQSIDIVLQDELIARFNLNPTDLEVNEAVAYIASQNNIPINILKQNVNFKLLEIEVKNNLSLFNLKNYLTKELEFKPSNIEIENFCKKSTKLEKQIQFAEIIISSITDSNKKQVVSERKIKEYLKKLKNHVEKGAKFLDLAKLHSQDSSYYNGGISDWKIPNTPQLKLIDKLNKNQVSDIYKKTEGWAIAIKIGERKLDIYLDECVKEINRKKAQEYFEKYMQDYKNKSRIKIYKKNL